ncbi:hypothetical protein [Spirillospora sp. NPDC029432]
MVDQIVVLAPLAGGVLNLLAAGVGVATAVLSRRGRRCPYCE